MIGRVFNIAEVERRRWARVVTPVVANPRHDRIGARQTRRSGH
jgi:hypothetical protein